MAPLLWLVPLVAGGLAYRARKRAQAAAIPLFDVGLAPDRARAVAIATGIGRGASGPIRGDTDPASVRAFASSLPGFPVAQAALEMYARKIGGANG